MDALASVTGQEHEREVTENDGWFPVKFDQWNDFEYGFGGGAKGANLDIDGAGVYSYNIGFGAEISGREKDFLIALMRATYVDSDTGHHLSDGHAQGIVYNGKMYAYFDGRVRELMEEKGRQMTNNNVADGTVEENKKLYEAARGRRNGRKA
jgi:hypothetical protein